MTSNEDAFWQHDLAKGARGSQGLEKSNPGSHNPVYQSSEYPARDVAIDRQNKGSRILDRPLSPNTARRLGEIGPHLKEVGQNLTRATNVAGRALATSAKQSIDTLTRPIEVSKFGCFDVLTGLISVAMFYFDVISDILVAYYIHEDEATKEWFMATVLLLVIPLVITNGFSLYWYWFDEHICRSESECIRPPKASSGIWSLRIIGHLLLQGSVFRYVDLLYYGIKSLKNSSLAPKILQQQVVEGSGEHQNFGDVPEGYPNIPGAVIYSKTGLYYQKLWTHAERDAANVDLLSSLVQDAPQLILQIYIMSFTIPEQSLQGEISNTLMMQLMSVGASVVAMAWSVGSFSKATRLAEPSMGNLSPAGLITLTVAHLCSIAPQVLCFALFSTKFLLVFFIVVSLHWLAATVLILLTLLCCANPVRLGATFTHDMRNCRCHRLDDVFFSAAFGLILLYTFVDVGGRKAKIQGMIYHILRVLEEGLMIGFWYMQTTGEMWYHWLPLLIVSSFFTLGIGFMAVYFYCVHPDRHPQPLSN